MVVVTGRSHLDLSVYEKARALCHQPRAWTTPTEGADMPTLPASYGPDTFPPCLYPGCDEGGRRWYGLCARHSRQYKDRGMDYGRLTTLEPRRDDPRCLSCGEPVGGTTGFKKWCSGRCEMRWRRAQPGHTEAARTSNPYIRTDRPTSVPCRVCGEAIDLTVIGPSGRIQRSDIKVCKECRRRMGRSRVNVPFVYHRDGPACGICGEHVDITLRRGDDPVRCASVDHIIPLARGGTDDPTNLQLAHLGCNQRKAANEDVRSVHRPSVGQKDGEMVLGD